MSARDELAKLLFVTDNYTAEDPAHEWEVLTRHATVHVQYVYDLADALLAAGWRQPRTITDHYADDGPDELPALSVVLSGGEPAIKQADGTFMDHDGSTWDTRELELPITVLHEPGADA
jgi:hypothetical protein